MSKQKKKGCKKNHPSTTEKVLFATAVIQLISALVDLIDKLLSG